VITRGSALRLGAIQIVVVLSGLASGCNHVSRDSLSVNPRNSVIALTHVTVFDGRSDTTAADMTVLIDHGKIVRVGATRATQIPSSAEVIPLPGRTLIPGLIDMHFHVITSAMRYRRGRDGTLDSTYDRGLVERLLRVALSKGITTIRDPGASPREAAITLRNDVAAGRVLGPRILTAGELISSPRLSEEQLRSIVQAQARAGVDFIKVYSGLKPDQVRIVVDEAHKRGLRVIGHLQRTSWTEAANAGIDFITHGANWHEAYIPPEHRAEYLTIDGMQQRIAWLEWLDLRSPSIDSLIRVLAARKISIDPTLVAYHTKFWWRDSLYQHDPERAIVPELLENWRVLGMPTADWTKSEFDRVQAQWPKELAFVKMLYDRGVLLTAGSDLASPWVIPGVGFHQELELLVSAGLQPSQVLRIATGNGAKALGVDTDIGTIEVGKRAELVVLDANPLADIRNTRSIRFVLHNGTLYSPGQILKASNP
jgi:imidazolonepropionase-like amidohydrolase